MQDVYINIPIEITTEEFDFQNGFEHASWQRNTFKEAFPFLSSVTEAWTNIPIKEAQTIIESEYNREKTKVGVALIEISYSLLTTTGLLIIIVVQIYLYIHLIGFGQFLSTNSNQDHSGYIPWVCLYDHDAAKFARVSSLILLPLATCSVMIYELYEGSTSFSNIRFLATFPFTALIVLFSYKTNQELSHIRSKLNVS